MLLSEKRKNKMFSLGLYLIGSSCGGKIEWYEHPIYGDEAGLLALYEGQLYTTDHYDIPDEDELNEADLIECYSS